MTYLIVAILLAALFGGAGGSFASQDEDEDWVASEMNKEGMNYKE